MFRTTFDLDKDTVALYIHTGLMHRDVKNHEEFVKCYLEAIDELLDIEEVDVMPQLDQRAISFKMCILRTFMSRGDNV